jgi:anti-sigma factor RsiW
LVEFPSLSAPFTRVERIGNNVKMTTDSQFDDRSHLQFHSDVPCGNDKHNNESTGAMDMMKRDRFELLSSYLDGEVTAAERRLVEKWLSDDPTVQSLHKRLLKLRQGLRKMPVSEPKQPIEETVKQVLARLHRRSRLTMLYTSGTIAACVIGAVSGLLLNNESKVPQIADKPPVLSTPQVQSPPPPVFSSPLMIAINNSVVPIPKAAEVSVGDSPENQQEQMDQIQSIPQQGIEKDIN